MRTSSGPRRHADVPAAYRPWPPDQVANWQANQPRTNRPEEDVVREHPYAAYVLQGYTFDIS